MFEILTYGNRTIQIVFATNAEYNTFAANVKERYHPLENLQQMMNENTFHHLRLTFHNCSNPTIDFIGTHLGPILPTLSLKTLRIHKCPLSANRSWIESPTVQTLEIEFEGSGIGMNFDGMSTKFPKLRTLTLMPHWFEPKMITSIFIRHNKITTLHIGRYIFIHTDDNLHLICPNLRTLTFGGICLLSRNVPQHSSGRVDIQRYLHRFFNRQQMGLRSLHNLRSLSVSGQILQMNRQNVSVNGSNLQRNYSEIVEGYKIQDLVKLKHSMLVGDTQQDTFMTIPEMTNILQDCPKLVDFPWTCFTPTKPADMFPTGHTQFNHMWWKLLRQRGWGTTFPVNTFIAVCKQISLLRRYCWHIMTGHDIYSGTHEANMNRARTVLQTYIEGMNRAGGTTYTSRDDFEHGAQQGSRQIAMSIFFPHSHIQNLRNQEFVDIMMLYVPTSADEPTQTVWGPLAAGVNQDCPITFENPIMTPCRSTDCEQGNHIFDMEALYNALSSNRECPLCRKPVRNVQVMSAHDVREYHNARRTGIPRAEANLQRAQEAVASAEAAVASTHEAIAATKRKYADMLQAAESKQADAVAEARQTREMAEHDAKADFYARREEIEQQRELLLKQLEDATHAKEIAEKRKEMLRHAVSKLRF